MGVPSLPEALQRRLRAVPDDEAAWQVFADRLLDAGDARGGVLQLRHGARPSWRYARQRAWRLQQAHQREGASWSAELPRLPPGWSFEWRDGIVVGLQAQLEDRERANLAELPALWNAVRARPAGVICRHLLIDGALDRAGFSVLEQALDSSVRPVGLGLSDTRLDADAALTLAQHVALSDVRALHLHGTALAVGLPALADTTLVEGLDQLKLKGQSAIEAFHDSIGALNVRQLALTLGQFANPESLAGALERIEGLRHLELAHSHLDFTFFDSSKALQDVKRVDLTGSRLFHRSEAWVAQTFSGVRELDFARCRRVSLPLLAAAQELRHLRIRAQTLHDLVDGRVHFDRLETLDLDGSAHGMGVLEQLIASDELPALRTLVLIDTIPEFRVAELVALRPSLQVVA